MGGLESLDEGSMCPAGGTLHDDGGDAAGVAGEQGIAVDPEAGKDARAVDALSVGN